MKVNNRRINLFICACFILMLIFIFTTATGKVCSHSTLKKVLARDPRRSFQAENTSGSLTLVQAPDSGLRGHSVSWGYGDFELDKDEQLGYINRMVTKKSKLTPSTPKSDLSIPNSVEPLTELSLRRSNLVKYCGANLRNSNRLVGEYERKLSLVARVSEQLQ